MFSSSVRVFSMSFSVSGNSVYLSFYLFPVCEMALFQWIFAHSVLNGAHVLIFRRPEGRSVGICSFCSQWNIKAHMPLHMSFLSSVQVLFSFSKSFFSPGFCLENKDLYLVYWPMNSTGWMRFEVHTKKEENSPFLGRPTCILGFLRGWRIVLFGHPFAFCLTRTNNVFDAKPPIRVFPC